MSENYWMKEMDVLLNRCENSQIYSLNVVKSCCYFSTKYVMQLATLDYRATMTLIIAEISTYDFGDYTCVSSNLLGKATGSMKLYGKFETLSIAYEKFFQLGLKTFQIYFSLIGRKS